MSWNVIEHDRALLALPALMAFAMLVAAGAIVGPLAWLAADRGSRDILFLAAALIAFPMNFISTFFGVAFVAVVRKRFAGEPASVRDGLAFARSRLRAIVGWALLATAVGLAIQALERVRGGAVAARIAAWLLGAAWSLATLFVLPVLASTDLGAFGSARESAEVARRKWGEAIAGTTAIGIAFGLLAIPAGIVFVIGYMNFSSSPAFGVIAIGLAAVLLIIVTVAQSAVEDVFRVALFDYAVDGTARAPFTAADLDAGLRPKRGLFGRAKR
jgi:hypothetical protein